SLDNVTPDMLIQKMVGRSLTDIYNWKPRQIGQVRLKVEGVAGPGVIEPASFEVAGGEILGIFGLVGAGRTELMKLIYGAERITSGTIHVDGKKLVPGKPADAIRKGLVFCPEDRKKEGIFPVLSVGENVNISARRTS